MLTWAAGVDRGFKLTPMAELDFNGAMERLMQLADYKLQLEQEGKTSGLQRQQDASSKAS